MLTTIWLIDLLTVRRVHTQLHNDEFDADDYATDTISLDGVHALGTHHHPRGTRRWAATPPQPSDRLQRRRTRQSALAA